MPSPVADQIIKTLQAVRKRRSLMSLKEAMRRVAAGEELPDDPRDLLPRTKEGR